MSTTRQLIGSLQIALKKTHDDADFSLSQIAYWCGFFINKYNSIKQSSGIDNGLYLSVYSNVPVLTATTDVNPNLVAGRKYSILPASILDLPNDSGIDYISYSDFDGACSPSFTGVIFDRTTPKSARIKYYSPYETPSSNKPCFYVVGNYIYYLGLECVDVNYLEMGLKTTFDPLADCGIDNNIPLDPALYDQVYKEVLSLGRFVMAIPVDGVNDASDQPSGQVPTQKLVSVNQPTSAE